MTDEESAAQLGNLRIHFPEFAAAIDRARMKERDECLEIALKERDEWPDEGSRGFMAAQAICDAILARSS